MEEKKVVYSKETIKMEVMSPERAARLLKKNINNRPISNAAVKKFKHIIENDMWERVGDCITIDKYGNLLNGQHRLTAIAEGKKSVLVDIKYGVDPNVRFCQNTGRTTTLSDKGAMFLSEIDLKKGLYSPICRVMDYFKNKGKFKSNKMDFNPKDVQDFALQEKIFPILKSVEKRVHSNNKFGNKNFAITKEILLRIVDEEKAKQFFDEIYDGSHYPNTVTHTLDNWLTKRIMSRQTNSRWGRGGEDYLNVAIDVAWECWCKNKHVQRLILEKDDKRIDTKIYDPENKLASFMN